MSIIQLLSRKTSGRAVIAEVDGFRFFAIATVVLYHLNTHLSRNLPPDLGADFVSGSWLFRIMSSGSLGVDVFFAISGFILALPFARQHLLGENSVSIRSYFLRRITRLEPPYVISLALFFFVHIIVLHEALRDVFPNFLASLFYAHSFVFNEWSKINPVAWSLEVEVQFYVLAPILALIFQVPSKWLRRFILVVVIVFNILHYNFNYAWIEQWHLRKSLLMHLHLFFVGFLVADVYLVEWKSVRPVKHVLWDLAGLISICLLFYLNQPFRVGYDFAFSFALLVLFISVFRGVVLNWFFTRKSIVVIGGMCYSIYLLHYAAIAFLSQRTHSFMYSEWSYSGNFWLQTLMITPVLLLISALFFVLIERPCMDKDWPQKFKAKIISIFAGK